VNLLKKEKWELKQAIMKKEKIAQHYSSWHKMIWKLAIK
jgi:hypothetical protein